MTRIVAGRLGGQTLKVPAKGTRPTSERVKEALFSKLEHMGLLEDTEVMDLFAGSGALGLEAISRGARRVLFVEKSAPASKLIAANVAALKVAGQCQVVTADAVAYVTGGQGQCLSGSCDLVLVDPPYDLDPSQVEALLAGLGSWITPDALVVLEASTRSADPVVPDFLVVEEKKKYGETTVWFLGPPVLESSEEELEGEAARRGEAEQGEGECM